MLAGPAGGLGGTGLRIGAVLDPDGPVLEAHFTEGGLMAAGTATEVPRNSRQPWRGLWRCF